MEPTTNTASGNGSKIIILVIVLIVIAGVMLAMRKKTEAPISDTGSGASMTTSQLQADVNGATTFDTEASLKAIDQEFK